MNITLLFKSVLYTSFMGSIAAVIIILFKGLLKNKVSAMWHYYIWFLLIIRLILPFAPASSFSVFNLFTPITQNIEITQSSEEPQIILNNTGGSTPVKERFSLLETNKKIEGTVSGDMPIKEYSFNGCFDILSLIWIIGGSMILFYMIALNIVFALKIRKYTVCTDKEILDVLENSKYCMKIKRNISLIYCRNLTSPSLFGIFKPKILVPSQLFHEISVHAKRYIFLHELAHFKRKDILINCVTMVLRSIHWFNPIIWYAFYKMQEDCELACDACVLSHIEPTEYKKYGETAIDLLKVSSKPYLIHGTAGMAGHGTGIKRRIHMITRFRKNSMVWTLIAAIIFAAAGIVILTNVKGDKGMESLKSLISARNINKAGVTGVIKDQGSDVGTVNQRVIKFDSPLTKTYKGIILAVKEIETVRSAVTLTMNDYSMNFVLLNDKGEHAYPTKSWGKDGVHTIEFFGLNITKSKYAVLRPYCRYESTSIGIPDKFPVVLSSGKGMGWIKSKEPDGVNERLILTGMEFLHDRTIVHLEYEGYGFNFFEIYDKSGNLVECVKSVDSSGNRITQEYPNLTKDNIGVICFERLINDPEMMEQLEIKIPLQ